MRDVGLKLNIAKSELHVQVINFLGLLFGKNGIWMDLKKIEAVQD